MKKKLVAFIGSAGVPNRYGGFEAFLEVISPIFAKLYGDVTVTCDSKRYQDKSRLWNGVHREFIEISANGASSIFHDLLAFFKVFRFHENIVILGVSSGIFFPIYRFLSLFYGFNLIVNVDGVEWRRSKFSFLKRIFLRVSDYFAQIFSNVIIYDNEALLHFILKSCKSKALFIPYSGDHILRAVKNDISKEKYFLTICRIEPENNCKLLLDSFLEARIGNYIFIGNWSSSIYGRSIRDYYGNHENIILMDPVYDHSSLANYRENCIGYIHGHSVGGTNPSLVEMLFYDVPIAAFDCTFNRFTARDDIDYFKTSSELSALMVIFYNDYSCRSRSYSRSKYRADVIAEEYLASFKAH